MALDLDQFTDKAQATVQAAIQLAKDYANSQSESISISSSSVLTPIAHLSLFPRAVYPAHIGFVLLNEGAGNESAPGGITQTQIPLFVSVIQKAGGDAVSTSLLYIFCCPSTLS